MLLNCFLARLEELRGVFNQERVFVRARRLLLTGLLAVGRRWITRMISAAGRGQVDWTGDYRLFARRRWDPRRLFLLVVRLALKLTDDADVTVAVDDTIVRRGGKRVAFGRWLRDPLSPKFHANLMRGVRHLHFSLLLRPRGGGGWCRGIPIAFELVEVVKKPGKKATKDELAAYRAEKKVKNLSTAAVQAIRGIRALLDAAGARDKRLVVVGDGGYCNRTVLRADYERTVFVARMRKDAALCEPAPANSGKLYGARASTPEQLKDDAAIPWITVECFHGGRRRELRYKEVSGLRWRRGTGRAPVRVIAIAPTPYHRTPNSKPGYRDHGYLLTRDLGLPAPILIQAYLYRWQIEVNHRDLKDTVGLGEAQVWTEQAVVRQPAFIAASYSLLWLAALEAYGVARTADYAPLPKWRRKASHPSTLDLVAQLRAEALQHSAKLEALDIFLKPNALTLTAAA